MNSYKINFTVKPIFCPTKKVCKDFAQIENLCKLYRVGMERDNYCPYNGSDYLDMLNNNKYGFAFAAFYTEEMIGFAAGYLKKTNMFLDGLYVNPVYQNFGVGTKLLDCVENSASVVASNIELFPLTNAIEFYQQRGYEYFPNEIIMRKKLSKTVNGVVPVFEWTDLLQAKSKVQFNSGLLKNKYQPIFVYVDKNNCIEGIATRLPNGERCIKLNDTQTELAKYRSLELSCALDDCR